MFGNLGYSAIDHGPEHEQEGYGAGVGREMAGEPRLIRLARTLAL